ncbi:MAG: leucine-rich repeat protein, partial [Tannerella sp.]|nr:leucine-rich repeat protein [Tannerella sp.]
MWSITNGTLTISGNGAMDDCYDPGAEMVIQPWGNAFTSVIITEGVTSIGGYAFKDCSTLTSVTISNSVTTIGRRAFDGCSTLASVTIPNSVTTIGDGAFQNCSTLASITIPNSVTTVGFSAFYGCSTLTSVTIPNSITTIGKYAFYDCISLEDVHVEWATPLSVPNDVFHNVNVASCTLHVSAGTKALYQAAEVWKNFGTVLDDVAIGGTTGSLTWSLSGGTLTVSGTGDMPDYERSNKSPWYAYSFNITSVNIGNGVTSIGGNTFSYYSRLTSVSIPTGVTSIGEMAFADCSSLTSVIIPGSVTSIGEGGVASSGLTSVTIPAGVTSIGDYAFSGCSGLTAIEVEAENPSYASQDGVLFNKDKTGLIVCPGGKTGTYVIPAGVTGIEKDAFAYCSGLTSVTIPIGVTSIEAYAFAYCSGLTSVTIPAGVTSIGNLAFYDCSGLTDVTVEWATPLAVSAGTFDGVTLFGVTLHVPAGTKALYQAAEVWKDFGQMEAYGCHVSRPSVAFTAAGGTENIDITASTAWTAAVSGGSASWLTVSPASGTGSGTVSVTAAAHTGAARTATVTVTADGVTRTVSIIQAAVPAPAPSLTVTPASLDFVAAGGSRNFTVTSNTSWTVTSSASWLTVSPASGTNSDTVSVTAAANTAEARTATV